MFDKTVRVEISFAIYRKDDGSVSFRVTQSDGADLLVELTPDTAWEMGKQLSVCSRQSWYSGENH